MTDKQPEWVIELEHISLGGWSYTAREVHKGEGLPSAFCLQGFGFSRDGALKKAKKDIREYRKDIERVYING